MLFVCHVSGHIYLHYHILAKIAKCRLQWVSLVAQMVKNLPAMQQTQVWSLGGDNPQRRIWQPTPVFLPGELRGQRAEITVAMYMKVVGSLPWLDSPSVGLFSLLCIFSLLTHMDWVSTHTLGMLLAREQGNRTKSAKITVVTHLKFHRNQLSSPSFRWKAENRPWVPESPFL